MVWLARFHFHAWSRNRSHRGSGVKIFTFVENFTRFLCYFYIVVGPASEQENLCSDRPPKNAKCVFFSFPRSFPKEKKNACSPSNTSYDVITKQFIFVIWIKSFPVFLVERCKMCFLLIPSLIPQKRKEKKREKKAYMESKTVMLLNSVLMTTLILLYVKI